MIRKLLALILTFVALTIPCLPQTRRPVARPAATSLKPFDSTVEKLPVGFQGTDLRELLSQLVVRFPSLRRGEYETNEAYTKRVSTLQNATISGSVMLKSTLAFVVQPKTEYLPDNGELFAGVARGRSLSSEVGKQGTIRISGTHTTRNSVLKNSSGARVPATTDIQSNYSLAIDHIDGKWANNVISDSGYGIRVKMPTAEAKATRDNLRLLLVCTLVAPFTDLGENSIEPTQAQTHGESIVEQYAAVAINDLWLFDQTTGRILSKAAAARPVETIAKKIEPPPVAAPTDPVDPPKTTRASSHFAIEELQPNIDRLPPHYQGIDPVVVWNELYKLGGLVKNEFETSGEFQSRVNESLKRPIIEKMTVNSLYALWIQESEFKYDAEAGTMGVESRATPNYTFPENKNADGSISVGAYPVNSRYRQTIELAMINFKDFAYDYLRIVIYFKIDSDAARMAKSKMRVLAVCSIEKPYATKTVEVEKAGSYYIYANVRAFLIYNFETGEIYARIPSLRDTAFGLINPLAHSWPPRPKRDYDEADIAFARGSHDADIGIFSTAKTEVERAIKLFPDEPRYRSLMSVICFRMNDREQAELNARLAVKFDPSEPRYSQILAYLLLGQNRLDEAEKIIDDAIRQSPSSALLHFVLGEIALGKENLLQAEAEYGIALKIEPKYKEAKDKLKYVQSQIKKRKD